MKTSRRIIAEIVGWYGVVAIISAYGLVSFGIIGVDSLFYQLLNLTGGLGILIVSLIRRLYQTVVTNTFWVVIASVALVRIFL